MQYRAGRGIGAGVACAALGWGLAWADSGCPQGAAFETVPFDFAGNMVTVPVRLNGQGPFPMALDTGSNVTVLDNALAERLGIKLGKKQKLGEAFGADAERPSLRNIDLKQVEFGGRKATDVTAVATDLSGMQKKLGRMPEGILGYSDVLHGQVLRIDYPARTLTFLRRSPAAEELAADRVTLPYRFRDGWAEKLLGVHAGPKVEAAVNGQKVWAQFDTGYNGSLLLTAEATKELGLEDEAARGDEGRGGGAGGALTYRRGRLGAFTLGSLETTDVPVIFLSPGATGKEPERKYQVNVGNGFLKEFRVTFDFRDKKVTLERPDGAAPKEGAQP